MHTPMCTQCTHTSSLVPLCADTQGSLYCCLHGCLDPLPLASPLTLAARLRQLSSPLSLQTPLPGTASLGAEEPHGAHRPHLLCPARMAPGDLVLVSWTLPRPPSPGRHLLGTVLRRGHSGQGTALFREAGALTLAPAPPLPV